jgi:hypothetical protein
MSEYLCRLGQWHVHDAGTIANGERVFGGVGENMEEFVREYLALFILCHLQLLHKGSWRKSGAPDDQAAWENGAVVEHNRVGSDFCQRKMIEN